MNKRLPAHITVIFDGSCNFCTWSVELLERLDRHHRVRSLPFQGRDVLTAFDLTQREAEGSAWVITPHGGRYRGAAAVNVALAVALGNRLPVLLYRLPGLRQLQEVTYAAVARNRHRFRGVRPYCQQHPEACA